jgi:hypothetical protein
MTWALKRPEKTTKAAIWSKSMDECNCNTLCGPLLYEYTLYGTQIEISFYRYHLLMGTSQQPFATREMHLQAKGIQSSLRVFDQCDSEQLVWSSTNWAWEKYSTNQCRLVLELGWVSTLELTRYIIQFQQSLPMYKPSSYLVVT